MKIMKTSDNHCLSSDKKIYRMKTATDAGFYIYRYKFLSFWSDKNLYRLSILDKNMYPLSRIVLILKCRGFCRDKNLYRLSRIY